MPLLFGPKRRYLGGQKPKRFWEDKLYPEIQETLEILDINYEDGYKLFQTFMDIDRSADGNIDLKEFYDYFKISQTKFSDRVFAVIDLDDTGELGFKEFVVGMWNYCTYDDRHLCRFAFDLFDLDKSGALSVPEVDALVRMMFNVEEADEKIMAHIQEHDSDEDAEIDLDEFLEVVRKYPEIMFPAFHIQEQVRESIFGNKYWFKATEHRRELFGQKEIEMARAVGADHMDSAKILQELLDERARQREIEKVEREAREKQEAIELERVKRERDVALLEMEKQVQYDAIAVLKSAESKSDRDEARAWRDFESAQEHLTMIKKDPDFAKIRKARQRMWVMLEDAILKREKNWAAKEVGEVERV